MQIDHPIRYIDNVASCSQLVNKAPSVRQFYPREACCSWNLNANTSITMQNST